MNGSLFRICRKRKYACDTRRCKRSMQCRSVYSGVAGEGRLVLGGGLRVVDAR